MATVHAVGRVEPGTAAAVCRTISGSTTGRLQPQPAIAPARPAGRLAVTGRWTRTVQCPARQMEPSDGPPRPGRRYPAT